MRQLKSCGILVFRSQPHRAFLLMRHPNRYDLPKGHMGDGETEVECAVRELAEETGIRREQVALDPEFWHTETYYPRYKRFGGETVEKTLVVFLGELVADCEILVGEHSGYEWLRWDPPHRIQAAAIDPLLAAVENWWKRGR
jgi:8-oxo-dGTP pyrophosphatase MutT (NUDIX family)